MEQKEQIYIKAFFGAWHPAGEEQAREFCKSLMYGMTCQEEMMKRRIEEAHLKGIALAELIGEEVRRC